MWKGGDLEATIAAIGEAGVEGLETFAVQLKPYHEEPERFTALLDAAGLRLSGAYFNSKEFVNPAAEEDVVAEAAADCGFLRKVGGEFLVVNGGPPKADPAQGFSDEDFRQLARVLDRIGAGAIERGVQAVMHPHAKCMVETPEDVDRLVEAGVDQAQVGLCVHASHQLHVGADPYAIYETYADWVDYAHIGDADRSRKGAFLGQGVLDQERLMRPLLEAGFDGWIVIECGKEGVIPEEYARNAMAYLRKTWPQVNWEA
jgi:inosose dehydratase